MTLRSRALGVPAAFVVVLALAGCAGGPGPVVTRLPSDGSAPATASRTPASPAPSATAFPTASEVPEGAQGDATDCAGAPVTLTAGSDSLVIVGDCPDVRVEGSAVTVDALGATVGSLTISGDRIRVEAAATGDVTVRGNDDTVVAASAGALVIEGDRNTLTVTGGSSALQLSGNDNVVDARPGGDVVVAGERNTIS